MLSHITGKSNHEESVEETTTFNINIIVWIREDRRLKWVGHILILKDEDSRQIKDALKVIFDSRQEVDILIDVPEKHWDIPVKTERDKDTWRVRVWKLNLTVSVEDDQDG